MKMISLRIITSAILYVGIFSSSLVSSSLFSSSSSIFDVKKMGAKADSKTDDSKIVSDAWTQACNSGKASTVVIPEGVYMVGPIEFSGPCKGPVTFQLEGTLSAPSSLQAFDSKDGWVTFQYVDGLTVTGGGVFDGNGESAWKENNCAKTGKCAMPKNLVITSLTNSVIRDITSLDSKMFHMNILNCKNLTLQHITINAPESSLNTDGIHIGRSSGINITDADIKTGDDCVSLGDGCQQINVEKVTCGPGHGISIGSLGRYKGEEPVVGVTVRNCTLTSTQNGVRVKTWPNSPNGVASNLHFEDITMDNVSNPVLIDQEYCPYAQCTAEVPSKIKISDVEFKNIRGTSASKLAVKLACSRGIPCQNVKLSDVNLKYLGKDGDAISQCSNVKPAVMGQLFPPACSAPAPAAPAAR